MASQNQTREYIKEYLKRMVALNRAIEFSADTAYYKIKKNHEMILKEIAYKFPKIKSRKEMAELNKILQNQIAQAYTTEIVPSVNQIFQEIITKELVWTSANLTIFSGTEANVLNSAPVANRALKKTYQGHTFNFWFNAAEKTESIRLENVLRQGYVTGTTTQEVIQEVEKVLGRTGNDVKTLTRSFLQHAATEARNETYEANQDIIEGYYWLATLDHRTTYNICGIRDGKLYDKDHRPIGHSLPWNEGPGRIHFNCRSTQLAKIINMPDVQKYLSRAAIDAGENYKRGDNVTRTGKVRKPNKDAREKGIFKTEQVKGITQYEQFLKKQPIDFIADVFDSKKLAQDFKLGKISLYEISLQGSAASLNTL